jgi:thioesterase domain-containing protein
MKSMNTTESSWVVPLREAGAKQPLFCACAGGADPWGYRSLAEALPDDQPVYSFGIPDFDQGGILTVEQLAEVYLVKIREIQDAGPYYLCGHSFGGLVAYEMAVRLAEMGENVGLLALFDTERPRYVQLMPTHRRSAYYAIYFFDRFRKYGDNIIKGRFSHIAYDAWKLCHGAFMRFGWPILRRLFGHLRQPLPEGLQNNNFVLTAAWWSYNPPTYSGRIVLFYASDRTPEYRIDPLLGWKCRAADGVERTCVAGGHTTMLHSPAVRDLADHLTPYLPVTARTEAA